MGGLTPLVINAADLFVGDIVGEGQEIWCTITGKEEVTAYWDIGPAIGFLHGSKMDKEHRLFFKTTDKLTVIRRESKEVDNGSY